MADTTGVVAAEAFIQKKRDEVRKARQRVERLEDALRHYEEIYNVMNSSPSRDSSSAPRDGAVRSGSQAERVIRVLSDAGEPTHIDEIMARMGVECTAAAKNSLVSSLSRYVRQRQIFTRPAPGTFGLIEWEEPEPHQPSVEETTDLPAVTNNESARWVEEFDDSIPF